LTLAAYATAMVSLGRAYEAIDRVLLGSSALCPKEMAAYTPRVPRIERDLRALDVGRAWLETAGVGTALKLPATEAECLGIRYVVEGAQFGGASFMDSFERPSALASSGSGRSGFRSRIPRTIGRLF
jgi:heme oxygenase